MLRGVGVPPPPITPRVGDEVAPEYVVAAAIEPKFVELPLVAKKLATSGRFDGIVCLGAVIRGETAHFDYVCANSSSGISSVSLETGVPISFGVLTTDTFEQAVERSGTKFGNHGANATVCAIEMARLLKQISEAQ